MDFSGDRAESTTHLHYWENTAPEFRLGLGTFSLFIYLFILTCCFFFFIYSESKFGYEVELVRIFQFVSISCLIFSQIKGINFISERSLENSCTHQLCKESCYKCLDCTP